jgi:hypothetical protein
MWELKPDLLDGLGIKDESLAHCYLQWQRNGPWVDLTAEQFGNQWDKLDYHVGACRVRAETVRRRSSLDRRVCELQRLYSRFRAD